MPSPTCLINSTSTLNGFNTTPGSTVTITLADSTGVINWSLTVYSVDDLQDIDVISAGLTITNFSATLVIPETARGCTIIMKSIVNNGNLNGNIMPEYTTTFGIFSLGSTGLRLLAAGQTTEGNATFGWIDAINILLSRNVPYSLISTGLTNNVRIAGTLTTGTITTLHGPDKFSGVTYVFINSASDDSYTMPDPTVGRYLTIGSSVEATILPHAAELVDFGASYTIVDPAPNIVVISFISDGIDWFVISPAAKVVV